MRVLMEKIHESRSAVRRGWSLVATCVAIVNLIPLALVFMAMPGFLTYIVLHFPANVEFWGSTKPLTKLLFLVVANVTYVWSTLLCVYWGIIPIFQKKPKIYDLLDDEIRIVFKDTSVFVIPFSDIRRFRFYDPSVQSKRSLLWKVLDPVYVMDDDKSLTAFQRLKRSLKPKILPYSFGFSSKEGGVIVERFSGIKSLRIALPWFNLPEKANLLALTPADPLEFFEQLKVAYEKWKRRKPQ